ncbi:MAG: hypothetical protein KAU23_01075 [Anaerolineales bacterium]|nr:hypothetical protein [Anaerolineales bacterium]
MNVAKVALTLIFLLLMILIFFALTGLDVNHPMVALERIIAWSGRLNRTVNLMLRELFLSIQIWIQGIFQ